MDVKSEERAYWNYILKSETPPPPHPPFPENYRRYKHETYTTN